MNVVVIGLGSMGKRRIRLIKALYPEYTVYGVDSREDRRNVAKEELGVDSFESVDLLQNVDCAFVCTSPLSHAAIIRDCLSKKWNVFTEINLVDDGYDDNIELARNNGCKLFLSSTFLYRDETRYIRSKVDDSCKWNYVCHIGQYLPDWHPWENYKDYFVGNKRTNGCREILAIELPWLVETFGNVNKYSAVADRITALGIDYDDNYAIQLLHENGNKGLLMVDVVSPVAVRKFEAYSEGKYLSWSGTPDSLFEYKQNSNSLEKVLFAEETEHVEGYSSFVVENAYKNEIEDFFEMIKSGREPLHSFEKDKKIIKLIGELGA